MNCTRKTAFWLDKINNKKIGGIDIVLAHGYDLSRPFFLIVQVLLLARFIARSQPTPGLLRFV